MNPPSCSARRWGLTVGPVQYFWSRERLLNFYADIADAPADCVVLGEVVCARRRAMRPEDWLALGCELAQAGKQVVLATQVLVETEADLRLIDRTVESAEKHGLTIEAGDASTLARAAGRVPLVLGPHINVYNRRALVEHLDLDITRWVPPLELSLEAIARIHAAPLPTRSPEAAPVETEVWAFGRMPLSFSARCFTARHRGVPKDRCGFPCAQDADGLEVSSTEGERLLVINGTQTQSAGVHCLLDDASALFDAGVHRLRLSPQSAGFRQVLEDFHHVFNEGAPAQDLARAWLALGVPQPLVGGYARGAPGMIPHLSARELPA